jgi:hypothetical protein
MKAFPLLLGATAVVAGLWWIWGTDTATTPPAPLAENTNTSPTPTPLDTTNGELYVHIDRIAAGGVPVIHATHITFFEGTEAVLAAENEVGCGESPIEECVPSLQMGYYARKSGAPEFSAPLKAGAVLTNHEGSALSLSDITTLIVRDPLPAFVVSIQEGEITSIRVVSR